jgi:hypothetical protein
VNELGKFINTEHRDMVDAITKGVVKDMLKNPYYLFENTKATPVIFYELDTTHTTLDDSTRMEYEQIGDNAPLRFKKIYDVYLYGLERMEIHYSNGENGLESDPIQGDCTDLPNTLNPTPGCYFEIPYLNEDQKHYLFQITDVSDDTMDDGNNIHKMSYELDMTDAGNWEHLQKQIVAEYRFIPSNVGTKDNSIVLESKYDLAEKLDELDTILRQYYIELFYNDRVQTFTYKMVDGYNINDSMVIEFIMHNKIMSGVGQDYMYVSHKNPVPKTFSIDYAKSLYRCIDTGDLKSVQDAITIGTYHLITNMTTIFVTRQESYYYMEYNNPYAIQMTSNIIQTFDQEFIDRLESNDLYDYNDSDAYKNIIIKYMNGLIPVTDADVLALEHVDYVASQDMYYTLPIVVFCVERYIKSLIST